MLYRTPAGCTGWLYRGGSERDQVSGCWRKNTVDKFSIFSFLTWFFFLSTTSFTMALMAASWNLGT